jgi:hypothetical protein
MPSAHVRHLAVDALEASRSRCLHLRVDARHPGVDARRLLPNKKLGGQDHDSGRWKVRVRSRHCGSRTRTVQSSTL